MEIIRNHRGSIILNTLIYAAMALFMSMMLLEFVKGHIYGQYAHIQRLNFEILKSEIPLLIWATPRAQLKNSFHVHTPE